jgi:hypothetical protein
MKQTKTCCAMEVYSDLFIHRWRMYCHMANDQKKKKSDVYNQFSARIQEFLYTKVPESQWLLDGLKVLCCLSNLLSQKNTWYMF